MRIGIIGAGRLGTALGVRLAAAGHELMLGFSREDGGAERAAAAVGHGARAGSPEDTAGFGEVAVLATPWAATLDAARALAPALAGRIVWDTTNALTPDMSALVVGTTTSGGEEVAAALPGARVVKAIAPFAELLASSDIALDGRAPAVFVCGDDAAARLVVLGLCGDIGAAGIEAGPLRNARYAEPMGMLLVQLAYAQGMGGRLAVALLRGGAQDG